MRQKKLGSPERIKNDNDSMSLDKNIKDYSAATGGLN